MFIKEFKITNYKSFDQTETVELDPKINVFTGKNNSGKTAILELLSLRFDSHPHRTIKSLPDPAFNLSSNGSSLAFRLVASRDELKSLLLNGQQELQFFESRDCRGNREKLLEFFKGFFGSEEFELSAEKTMSRGTLNWKILKAINDYRVTIDSDGRARLLELRRKDLKAAFDGMWDDFNPGNTLGLPKNEATRRLVEQLEDRIYVFRPERFQIGTHSMGTTPDLETDARNLPSAIHHLYTTNRSLFDDYLELVQRVLPFIKHISPVPVEGNQIRIFIWNHEPSSRRSDLAIPLSESGTGVSQVLAILYTLIYSPKNNVIVIDEPNSFLHPKAVRELLEITQEVEGPQLILTTHSPEVISNSRAKKIFLVKNIDGESSIESTKGGVDSIRLAFSDLGVKLQDVFGYDSVLWVEGKTEELFFPELIPSSQVSKVVVLSVKNTGDLEGKKAELIFQLYRRLSEQEFLVPPTVGFIFDKENKTSERMEDINRMGEGLVHFLGYRMFENYLLILEDIAAEISHFNGKEVNQELVEAAILGQGKGPLGTWETLEQIPKEAVHGAKLLEAVYSALLPDGFEYKKTEHSVSLARRVLDNHPESLQPIKDTIEGLVGA